MLVPTAGLEPAQVAPLAPQTSASTNFATSAWICHGLRPTLQRGSPGEPRKLAALRADKIMIQSLTVYFGGVVESGTAGAGACAGAGAVAGGGVSAGGGALEGAAAAARAARSNTEFGSTVVCEPRYAKLKLVTKNRPANTAVNFENKVLVPRAPNTVPDAPEPNPAPASAPLPRCSSTSPIIISASNTCTPNITPRNIKNLFSDERPQPRKSVETHRRSRKRHPPNHRPRRAWQIALRHCRLLRCRRRGCANGPPS
jgi:hypothetical protein